MIVPVRKEIKELVNLMSIFLTKLQEQMTNTRVDVVSTHL